MQKKFYLATHLITAILLILTLIGITFINPQHRVEASGGSYSLTWTAADPALNNAPYLPTYLKLSPAQLASPDPSGGLGRLSSPLANAIYGNPRDAVTSLSPYYLALGQIVPFELKIAVSGSVSPENGKIEIFPNFYTKTTSNQNFGFDPAYGIYCAFVDYADSATVNATTAKVDSYSYTILNPGTNNEQIKGDIVVSGLKDGDTAIVEIWVVLKNTIAAGTVGNVQTGLLDAHTYYTPSSNINLGNQVVPLLRVADFLTKEADLSISKTDSPDPAYQGQQLTYSIVVTNTSTDTVSSCVTVTDTLDANTIFVSASGAPYTQTGNTVTFKLCGMNPQQSATLLVTVTISNSAPYSNDPTLNPEPGGHNIPLVYDIYNRVVVSSTTIDPSSSNNTYYQPTNVLQTITGGAPSISLEKSGLLDITVVAPIVEPNVGDKIYYTFTVTNDGDVPLTDIILTDPLISISGGPLAYLAPGASDTTTFTGTYTLVQPEICAGQVNNTATVTATLPDLGTISDTDSETITLDQFPSLLIEKSHIWASGNGSNVGDIITYFYKVTNTGNTSLDNLTVTDDILGDINLPVDFLLPGGFITGSKNLTLTQHLLDQGYQTNTATADGVSPCEIPVTDQDNDTVSFIQDPSISIAKSYAWTHGQGNDIGDNVTYYFTVINTGNVTLDNVSVTDDKLGTITLGSTSLSPGQSTSGSSVLTLTGELLGTYQTNIATASGEPPSGAPVSDTDSQTVHFSSEPSIDISKSFVWTSGNGSHVGDIVTYSYSITNTGNISINNILVEDDILGTISLDNTTLSPGQTAYGSKTLTVTQEHLDTGFETNIATVTGTHSGGTPLTDNDTASVHFIQSPSVSIIKSHIWAVGNGGNIGDIVTYTFTITNTGNVTLDNISVIDDKLGTITPASTTLAPGQITTGSKNLTLTQELLDTGYQTNTVETSATAPDDTPVTAQDDDTVNFIQHPSITIEKPFSWTTGDGTQVDDVVTYYFIVTNTGNVTLDNVTVHDDKLGNITLDTSTLAPGQTTQGSGTLTVTEDLLISGSQTNTATATGQAPSGVTVHATHDQTVHFTPAPSIDISKSAAFTTGNGSHIGDVVTYYYVLTNTGNLTLSLVEAIDDQLGPVALDKTTLIPGDTALGTKTLILTQELLDAGSETNNVTANGTPPSGPDVSDSDIHTLEFNHYPSIEIEKSHLWTSGNGSDVGDVVTYNFLITNTGNVTLDNLTINDNNLGEIIPDKTSLAPGETASGTATLMLTQELLNSGSETNIATVSGTPPSGNPVNHDDTQTVNFIQIPGINIFKSFIWHDNDSPFLEDNVTYYYTVINTGNVTLDNVSILDDKLGGITLDNTTLAPGQTAHGSSVLIIEDELLMDNQTNIATALGYPPSGIPVSNSDSQTVHFSNDPSIDVSKSFIWTTGSGSHVGDVVTYYFQVTNTGEATLDNVTVIDDKLGNITLDNTTLEEGDYVLGTKTLTLTQELLDSGFQTNIATATGDYPEGQVSDNDSCTVYFHQSPSLLVDKSHSWTTGNGNKIGDVVTYTFTVTNTGNVTLYNVTVVDDKVGIITLGTTTLAPGQVTSGTKSLVLTQELFDAGVESNTATASGNPAGGGPVSGNDGSTITLLLSGLEIVKSVEPSTIFQNEEVTFTFTLTNPGEVALHDIYLSDSIPGVIPVYQSGDTNHDNYLDPTETWIFTATYTPHSSVTNSVIATGTDPSGNTVTGQSSISVRVVYPQGVGGEVSPVNRGNIIIRGIILTGLILILGLTIVLLKYRRKRAT